MSKRLLLLDRDGTLIREPADFQIDSFEKLSFLPGVICALRRLVAAGYTPIMVTNQDRLGTEHWPEAQFWPIQRFVVDLLAGEGIVFEAIFIDNHTPEDNHPNRKPGTGMLTGYLSDPAVDWQYSYVVGDRQTDARLAQNLGCHSLTIHDPQSHNADLLQGTPQHAPTTVFTTWQALADYLLAR